MKTEAIQEKKGRETWYFNFKFETAKFDSWIFSDS